MHAHFEMELIQHCSAVLLNKKPASLFTSGCSAAIANEWNGWLYPYGVTIRLLKNKQGRQLVLVYRADLLKRTLECEFVKTALQSCWYTRVTDLSETLEHLICRLASTEDFPHEIGFFLGYSPKDVAGFMHYKGTHCKHYGLWKVYDDVDAAASLASVYVSCRQMLQEHVGSGGSLLQLCTGVKKAG